MGCKLFEIMADGLYAIFHRFEASHRWLVYCWMSIQRPSCFFNLCSSCSSRSNKRWRDCLLPPARRSAIFNPRFTASTKEIEPGPIPSRATLICFGGGSNGRLDAGKQSAAEKELLSTKSLRIQQRNPVLGLFGGRWVGFLGKRRRGPGQQRAGDGKTRE